MLSTRIGNVITRLHTTADRLRFLGPTLARPTVGLVFIGTGWGKLHSLANVTDFFATLHIPAPAFHARLTATTEFLGGLLVLLGLGTRLASIPLAFIMVVAIATAKRDDISGLSALVGLEEWSYLVLLVWLAVAGGGPFSLDHLLQRLRKRQIESTSRPSPPLRPQS